MVRINDIRIKEYLSFKDVKIKLKNKENNLILFTGASGVGKSILMNAILSSFAIKPLEASLVDLSLENDLLENEDFEITKGEDILIKGVKNTKTKYLLNDLNISKKKLLELSNDFIKHISLKNVEEFETENFLDFIDKTIFVKKKKHEETLSTYRTKLEQYNKEKKELDVLIKEEEKVEELKEFLSFEIEKINKVKPSETEYEELQDVKKKLSQKDKITAQLKDANNVVSMFGDIYPIFETLDLDKTIIEEAQSYIESTIADTENSFSDLEDVDIEHTLDRISEISQILKKYGTIENMNKVLAEKEQELEKYTNIEVEKNKLLTSISKIEKELKELSETITHNRKQEIPSIIKGINKYLEQLFLKNFNINLVELEKMNYYGNNEVELSLNNTSLSKISSGEFNRVRLAFLSLKSDLSFSDGGILFLDEIDANVSGKESEGIAHLVKKLSFDYQIFSISHQPQLTSMASQHFVIEKKNDESQIRELEKEEDKINEIARMISGKDITEEAISFASKLFK